MKKLTKKGFTLIEVLVVVAIIAIMAAVLVPTYLGYVNTSKARMDALEVRNADLNSKLTAIQAEIDAVIVAP